MKWHRSDGPCPFLLCLETEPHRHPICGTCGAVRFGNLFCKECQRERPKWNLAVTRKVYAGRRWRWTPPQWIRHFTPWSLLYWINDHFDCCWSGIVCWKMGYDGRSWDIRPRCFNVDHPDPKHRYDYCGRYDDRACDRFCGGGR